VATLERYRRWQDDSTVETKAMNGPVHASQAVTTIASFSRISGRRSKSPQISHRAKPATRDRAGQSQETAGDCQQFPVT